MIKNFEKILENMETLVFYNSHLEHHFKNNSVYFCIINNEGKRSTAS